TKDGIALPVHTRDARPVESRFLVQRTAKRLEYGALDLVTEAIRVDDQSAIVRASDSPHIDLARGAIDGNLHRHRDVIFHLFVPYVCHTSTNAHVALLRS